MGVGSRGVCAGRSLSPWNPEAALDATHLRLMIAHDKSRLNRGQEHGANGTMPVLTAGFPA
jgi:hypothetical protein